MATAASQASPSEKIAQLSHARKLALGDAAYYAQIVPGVLPIIGPTASLELRRWGAEFLAETFACPTLPTEQKEKLSLLVLDTLRQFLDIQSEDTAVVKSMVQIATSIYPHVFKHTIFNPTNGVAWPQMAAIKSNILRRMDSASPGVRVCCIKFIQRVVQVQTPGLITDPRRSEQNDLSLALVPQGHALLSPPNLQAEAFGLLDRLLNVFQEERSDPLYVTATINSIGPLVRTRASLTTRILNALLTFNPFKLAAGGSMTPRIRIACKSMERTVRAFLTNLNKSNPTHPMAGRIQGYLDRLQQMRLDIIEDGGRKRAAPVEPTDGLDSAKRQRLGADVTERSDSPEYPALPPGPVSIAQLFTLTTNEDMKNFDVQSVPIQQVNRIVVPILARIDTQKLDNALKALRARYLKLTQAPSPESSLVAVKTAIGTDGEPSYPHEDAEQLMNRLDHDSSMLAKPPEVSFGPLVIPQPAPLTAEEVQEYGKGIVIRVFDMVNSAQEVSPLKKQSAGLNRLAAGDLDARAWITILARLATRSLSGLESPADQVKKEAGGARSSFSVGDVIRDGLYVYILNDFRRHIDVAISWLNEEWYNDQIQLRNGDDPPQRYDKWALKVLDGILPYLDAKDKVLIRFLSEIPRVSEEMLQRVKRLAHDPERVALAVNSLHYLALFRPPVREMCIDALEDLWRNYDDAKISAQKMLQRWRPQILQGLSEPQQQQQQPRVEPHPPAIAT